MDLQLHMYMSGLDGCLQTCVDVQSHRSEWYMVDGMCMHICQCTGVRIFLVSDVFSLYHHTRPEAPGHLLTSLHIGRQDSAQHSKREGPHRNCRVARGQTAMARAHRYHRLSHTWALRTHRGILVICFKTRLLPLKWMQFVGLGDTNTPIQDEGGS